MLDDDGTVEVLCLDGSLLPLLKELKLRSDLLDPVDSAMQLLGQFILLFGDHYFQHTLQLVQFGQSVLVVFNLVLQLVELLFGVGQLGVGGGEYLEGAYTYLVEEVALVEVALIELETDVLAGGLDSD